MHSELAGSWFFERQTQKPGSFLPTSTGKMPAASLREGSLVGLGSPLATAAPARASPRGSPPSPEALGHPSWPRPPADTSLAPQQTPSLASPDSSFLLKHRTPPALPHSPGVLGKPKRSQAISLSLLLRKGWFGWTCPHRQDHRCKEDVLPSASALEPSSCKEGYWDRWAGVPCALAASGPALTPATMQGLVRRHAHAVLDSTPGKRKGDFTYLHFCGAREKEKAPSPGSRGKHLPGAPGRRADKQRFRGGSVPFVEGVGCSRTWARFSAPHSA